MSNVTGGNADTDARVGFKGAIIGTLGGLFVGVAVSAVTNAATAVPVTLAASVANPFTATLVLVGAGLGYLEAVA